MSAVVAHKSLVAQNVRRERAARQQFVPGDEGARSAQVSLRMVAGTLPLLIVLACGGTAAATTAEGVSAADQPGVTGPSQPGTSPAPPPPAPPSDGGDEDVPAIRDVPAWRPVPPPDRTAPPIPITRLHLPGPTPRVAPILAPPGTIRVGTFITPAPKWLPVGVVSTINRDAAMGEAGLAQLWDSIGIPARRSDRLAAGTTAGAVLGVAAGGLGLGIPAAVVGGVVGSLIGGTIGGIAGAALGTLIPVPLVGTITSGVAGTAIGAAAGGAIGAGVAGLPALGAGVIGGGVLGVGVGAAVGVGQR